MGLSLSFLDLSQFGASLALRTFSRLGRGFSLSLRVFSRLGDSLSLFGSPRYGSSLAVLGYTPGFVSIASLGSAIGRVAFRLIFLPDRVFGGVAELLSRREISLGSNLLLMALRRWGQVCRFGISKLADRRCPCSAYHDSPHPYL